MEEWKKLVRDTVNTPEKLAAIFDVDLDEIKRVHEVFPIRINPYYLSLIEEPGDPIWKQVVPDAKELIRTGFEEDDPLGEEDDSLVPNVTHRYPDRVLFYVNYMCPIYCRFCTRKAQSGGSRLYSRQQHRDGLGLYPQPSRNSRRDYLRWGFADADGSENRVYRRQPPRH